ncbi:MAG TPA: thioesterase [Candidatus Krumholzibacteria bacterium]|nr:thioesterase [Candidatus Krumholzibacteria bacterium]HPD72530.1 thioesterase [Candidatus Krumholzibacteria bacterium]HRY40538.1 thioesterase [Candidatus Krumholzibacteria bacterium]
MDHEIARLTGVEFQVASWDVDARGLLTTAAMGRFMQEAAETNARTLGAGFDDLQRAGQTWVLSGLLIRVDRYPRFRDRIRIETWPRDIVRRRALRDFRLRAETGAVFAAAASAWFCLDLADRRPVSPERWRTRPWQADERALDGDCGRLPAIADADAEVAVPLRWGDLDLVGHVTNTRYQELLMESYSAEWLRNHEIAEIELNFLAEGQYPDTLVSRRLAESGRPHAWLHALVRQSDGKDVCRARVAWR